MLRPNQGRYTYPTDDLLGHRSRCGRTRFPVLSCHDNAGKRWPPRPYAVVDSNDWPILVGGYLVSTPDNYNGGYLLPVLELDPGDTLKVHC